MKLYIKYMVSQRCKLLVKDELNKLGISYSFVDLGVVETFDVITSSQLELLREVLKKSGLELLVDKKSVLVVSIKKVIIELIHYNNETQKSNYSDFLSEKLGYDYTYLANVFSEVEGITIQQFIILNKIERVKELISYDELSFNEIAYQMRYSSAAHLSNQFKRVTGLTPTYYKTAESKSRTNLENV